MARVLLFNSQLQVKWIILEQNPLGPEFRINHRRPDIWMNEATNGDIFDLLFRGLSKWIAVLGRIFK